VTARRWRRYGFDRLYGDTSDGCCVGWLDLDTGEVRIEIPALGTTFERAVAEWQRARSGDAPAIVPVWSREVTLRSLGGDRGGRLDVDLAMNRAGERPHSQALAIRRSEPIWTLLSRLVGVHCDERAWRLGAKGEEIVAKELATLGPKWHVLHSIPLGDGGADVDHLVIGPAGVFSLRLLLPSRDDPTPFGQRPPRARRCQRRRPGSP
jgi:hypothetical protein